MTAKNNAFLEIFEALRKSWGCLIKRNFHHILCAVNHPFHNMFKENSLVGQPLCCYLRLMSSCSSSMVWAMAIAPACSMASTVPYPQLTPMVGMPWALAPSTS